MVQLQKKICPSCQKEFIPKYSQKQKYCDSYRGGPKTCKTYASRVRTGKMESLEVVAVGGVEGEPTTIEEKVQQIMENNFSGMSEVYAIGKELEKSIQDSIIEFNRIISGKSSLLKEIKDLKEELGEMESYGEAHLNESDLAQFREEKQDVRNELATVQKILENEDKRRNELEIIIPIQQIERFRILEKSRTLFKAQFANEKLLSLADYKALSKFDIVYPFGELFEAYKVRDQFHTSALGKLPQPFLVNIFGEKESGKTSVMLTLVSELTNDFKAPVLYLIDFNILINDFWEIAENKGINNEMDLLRLENRMQITQYLAKKDYEFLVLDLSKSYNLNYKFFFELQKQYPKLSIFSISVTPLSELAKTAHLIIEVKNGVGVPKKGGNQDRCILGWQNASADDFDPAEEDEEDYEEVEMIPYDQYQQPMPIYQPIDFEQMFKAFLELQKMMTPQIQAPQPIDKLSPLKDKEIELLKKLKQIKLNKAAKWKALMDKRKR